MPNQINWPDAGVTGAPPPAVPAAPAQAAPPNQDQPDSTPPSLPAAQPAQPGQAPQTSAPAVSNKTKGGASIAWPTAGTTPVAPPPANSPQAQQQAQDQKKSFVDQTLDFVRNVASKKTIAGENTALGAGLSPSQAGEVSGVSKLLHGNITEGLEDIAQSESPHVIQGSPIEKMIQQVNPSFHGSKSPDQAAFEDHQNRAGLENPAVDVAQHIDVKAHPALKAIAETAQSLTSPANVAMLYGTGGLGLVESPKALATAHQVLNAGFSASAIGSAYKAFPGIKDAYDRGDAPQVIYQLTHALLSGSLGLIAAQGALGIETPIIGDADRAVVAKAHEGLSQAGSLVSGATSAVSGATSAVSGAVSAVRDFITPPESAEQLVGKITQATGDDVQTAKNALGAVNQTKLGQVETAKDLSNLLDSHVTANTAKVDAILDKDQGVYNSSQWKTLTPTAKGAQLVSDPINDALDQLKNFYKKTKDTVGEAHIQDLQDKASAGLTLKEINDLAREHSRNLNAYNANNELASGLSKQAAENTRIGIKDFVRKVSPETAAIDQQSSDLITTRGLVDKLDVAAEKVRNKLQTGGVLARLGSGIGTAADLISHGFFKSLLKSVTDINGVDGQQQNAVTIEKNLNDNIEKLNKLSKMSPQAAARAINVPTTPVESPNWSTVSGSAVPEGFKPEDLLHHELGHAIIGEEGGFNPIEIQSNAHPDLAGRRNTLARAKFSYDNLNVGPDGVIGPGKLVTHLDGLLKMIMGGAAANEVVGGIPLAENPAIVGDLREAKKMLKNLGYSDTDAEGKLQSAFEAAKEHMNRPGVADTIRNAAQTREVGLDKGLHYSKGRLQEIINQSKGVNNGETGDTGRPSQNISQLGKTTESGREDSGARDAGQEAPRSEATQAVKVPRETSTGDPKIDQEIKDAGAVPGGKFLGLTQFHDPLTGSSLTIPDGEITPERLKAHLQASRKAFGVNAPEVQAEVKPGSFADKLGKATSNLKLEETATTKLSKARARVAAILAEQHGDPGMYAGVRSMADKN